MDNFVPANTMKQLPERFLVPPSISYLIAKTTTPTSATGVCVFHPVPATRDTVRQKMVRKCACE